MSTETVITASSPTPLTEVFQLDSSNVSHCILDYHKVYYVKKFMFMFQLSISYRNTPPWYTSLQSRRTRIQILTGLYLLLNLHNSQSLYDDIECTALKTAIANWKIV